MADIIIVLVLLLIIGLAVGYIIKAKKDGVKCIGCPSAGSCSKSCTTPPSKITEKKKYT